MPKLARNDVHVSLDSSEFAFSIRHDLISADRGIQLQIEFARKFFSTNPPLTVGSG